MAGKSKAISEDLFLRCKAALKKQSKQSRIGIRLQAIISAKTHGITKVAKIYGITRSTLMSWIKGFAKEEEQGLVIKSGRGRRRIFNAEDEKAILGIINKDPDITIDRLRIIIKDKLKIKASRATIHRVMQKLGFAYITPRASHYKTDTKAKEAFKKKSQGNG